MYLPFLWSHCFGEISPITRLEHPILVHTLTNPHVNRVRLHSRMASGLGDQSIHFFVAVQIDLDRYQEISLI